MVRPESGGVAGPGDSVKITDYYRHVRKEVLALLGPARGLSVLEIGCGSGSTLGFAKRTGIAARTVGVDVRDFQAEDLDPDLDLFVRADVNQAIERFGRESFDVIVAADVLEHLFDPWAAIRRLATHLRPGGRFVASIPNVGHRDVLRGILFDRDFRYEEEGLLDRSHLRFFARRGVESLFEQAGLEILEVAENLGAYGKRRWLLNRMTFLRFHDLFVYQFLVLARKPSGEAR